MMFGQEKKKKAEPEKPDMVKRIQEMSAAQQERDKKAAEEKKKKGKVETAPSKGVLGRLYDTFIGSSEKKK
jgi:hypothetical protein